MKRILASALASLILASGLAAQASSYNLKSPIADKPAFLTSAGQSADVEMTKVLLDRAKVPYKADSQAKPEALRASGSKALVVVIGGSSKGLGAAGVSADAELARSKSVIADARKLGMKVVGLHIGGEARRGELSDAFVREIVPLCDYVIVVAEGNKDGLFTRLCSAAKIPLDVVDKISKAGDPLVKAFK